MVHFYISSNLLLGLSFTLKPTDIQVQISTRIWWWKIWLLFSWVCMYVLVWAGVLANPTSMWSLVWVCRPTSRCLAYFQLQLSSAGGHLRSPCTSTHSAEKNFRTNLVYGASDMIWWLKIGYGVLLQFSLIAKIFSHNVISRSLRLKKVIFFR